MPPILSTSWGGANANAYTEIGTIDFLLGNYVLSAARKPWDDADDTDKGIAAITASRQIDMLSWKGERLFFDQTMEFPRTEEDGERFPWTSSISVINTWNIFQTQLKEDVYLATAFQALHVLRQQGRDPHREKQSSGIVAYSQSAQRISESYTYGRPSMVLHTDAARVLRDYRGTIRVVR